MDLGRGLCKSCIRQGTSESTRKSAGEIAMGINNICDSKMILSVVRNGGDGNGGWIGGELLGEGGRGKGGIGYVMCRIPGHIWRGYVSVWRVVEKGKDER